MRRFPLICSLAAGLLQTGLALAAEVAPASRPFAAPQMTSAAPAGTVGGIAQVTFSLLLVLVAVFVVAVLLKRFRNLAGGGAGQIEVLSQTSLGQRERAVIVRVGDTRLLLGVASGQVTLLHTLPADARIESTPVEGDPVRPTFANLLRKSLGR